MLGMTMLASWLYRATSRASKKSTPPVLSTSPRIPPEEAAELLRLCEPPLIEKVRRRLKHDGLVWEVDEFLGDNQGLVVAEIELDREDREFTKPPWVGEEVTHDPRFYNANLVENPFTKWQNPD